ATTGTATTGAATTGAATMGTAMSDAAVAGDQVRLVKTEKDLSLLCKDRPVLRYRHAPMPPPPGASERYTRSAFIHPLWSPQGAVLTDIHPKDHIHHMGIWFPWTSTEFEGKHVDFWNLNEGQGTVRFVKYLGAVTGPVYGGFQSQHEHVALQTETGEKVVLQEVWDVRVYNVGGPAAGYWLCDFRSVQKNVADSPLRLNEYRYGGFGFRGSPDWRGEKGAYLTSEGKTRKDANATRSRWCDVGGVTPSGWSGVVLMSHPDNREHPEPMRIWPGENDLVFFGFVPAQKKAWDLLPGHDYTFRYRWYVHEGKINPETAERVWTDFGRPPTVTVEKKGSS
ncbi:MAG: PmoA family protein, partial [Sedimentisphaerales bacterium]|nr:PmoA family protein [Sedimentisphaerales bacterium]